MWVFRLHSRGAQQIIDLPRSRSFCPSAAAARALEADETCLTMKYDVCVCSGVCELTGNVRASRSASCSLESCLTQTLQKVSTATSLFHLNSDGVAVLDQPKQDAAAGSASAIVEGKKLEPEVAPQSESRAAAPAISAPPASQSAAAAAVQKPPELLQSDGDLRV